MSRSPSESQQTQTFSIDHENVLPEHYRLVELVGRGGMAEVFLAEDRRLGRKVAIKFLNAEFRRDADRVRRFRQEARSASALNHPNILTIHDIGDVSGVYFIVSEFVEGETLGLRIAQGNVPYAEAVDIAAQAASALTAAHAAGIVHRDIKPDNLMIRPDGAVKVLDFGLAKPRQFTAANAAEFDALTLDSGSTSPGLIVGTPQYMSPEQARGKELDGRTDVFSLGIIIFEMITRHSPFEHGNFADTMAAILTKEPRKIDEFVSDAPLSLVRLIDKCLRKERDDRFVSMAEVETELRSIKAEVDDLPRNTAEIDPARSDRTMVFPTDRHSIRKFVSRTFEKPSPIAASIILIAGVLVAGGWWTWQRLPLASGSPSLMRTVPITSWSSSANEHVTSASFSPDGRMIAYSVLKNDATEIWIKPVEGGDSVQVTKDGAHNQYPIWSPDGQSIVFRSDRETRLGLWRIPFTGGHAVKIFDTAESTLRPIRWGTDGRIFYQAAQSLFSLVEGEESQKLADLTVLGPNVRMIQISPDESSIAFALKEENGWKVNVSELSGAKEREVASTKDQIDHIAWHPNGKALMCSFSVEGILQVFEVSLSGSQPIQRTNGDLNFIVHDVAANGSVLYGTLSETSDLWRIDTQTNSEKIVANEVASEMWPDISLDGSVVFQSASRVERIDLASINTANSIGENGSHLLSSGFAPAWSNDGKWVAFLRRVGTTIQLWKARPNGLDLTQVSDADVVAPQYDFAPYNRTSVSDIAWSPDDSKIAFTSRLDGDIVLTVSSADGSLSRVTAVRDPGVERSPLWTADGKSLVYMLVNGLRPDSPDRRYSVFRLDVDSGQKQLIFETRKALRILGISNAADLAYVALNPDATPQTAVSEIVEILSIPLNGGGTTKIIDLQNIYHYNTHLSDSSEILAYVSQSGGLTKVATMTLRTRAERTHLLINDPKVLVSNLGVSRDGSFIVYGKQTRTYRLSMLALGKEN